MGDSTIGAQPAAGGLTAFLTESLASLKKPELAAPALVLTVLLTFSNIVILRNPPVEGQGIAWPFALAAAVRMLGLFALAVALLRLLNDSPRSPWKPDGAMFLYVATVIAGLALSVALGLLAGERDTLVAGALVGAGMIVLSAPLAAWFTAIAVERPLAWRPRPWLRGFGRWLAPLIFWSLLVVLPLGQLHAAIDMHLIRGAGDWFWPLALFDGPLSALLALFSLALASTAYRRVARP